MNFDLFRQLYSKALEDQSLEYYIAERGWEEWMDEYDSPQDIADTLTHIYTLANNPLKDTRKSSRAEFSRKYVIPIRTLEDWDLGNRTPPTYVKLLIDFAQYHQSKKHSE